MNASTPQTLTDATHKIGWQTDTHTHTHTRTHTRILSLSLDLSLDVAFLVCVVLFSVHLIQKERDKKEGQLAD